jgi:two-component system sensor histidine kinase PilS (NtrC family)
VGNLVQNAAEATGSGGSLRVHISASGPGQVTARFQDDGPGVPAEDLPRLFRPFHTTKEGGTGLGLALVHRVMEAHGGRITAESPPEGGAVFTMVLPAARPAPETGRST